MKKWRLDFRIWHWVNATVVLGLLGTVFLRKTFLSWRTNSELLTQKLSEINLEVTEVQAKVLAKDIRAPMREWHIILGMHWLHYYYGESYSSLPKAENKITKTLKQKAFISKW